MTTDWENEGGRIIRHTDILCPLCKQMTDCDWIGVHLLEDHRLPYGTCIDPKTGEQLSQRSSASGFIAEDD